VTHDIDEAVYLGQRVLILSSSPAVVRDDLAIDLPDERDQLTTRSSPRFAELRARVYERCTARRRRRSSRSPAERSADPNGSEHPATGPQLRALRPAGALSPTSTTSGAFRVGAVLIRCRRQNCPRGQSRKSVAPSGCSAIVANCRPGSLFEIRQRHRKPARRGSVDGVEFISCMGGQARVVLDERPTPGGFPPGTGAPNECISHYVPRRPARRTTDEGFPGGT